MTRNIVSVLTVAMILGMTAGVRALNEDDTPSGGTVDMQTLKAQMNRDIEKDLDQIREEVKTQLMRVRQKAQQARNELEGMDADEVKTALQNKRVAAEQKLDQAIADLDRIEQELKNKIEEVKTRIQTRVQEKMNDVEAARENVKAKIEQQNKDAQ
jgi:DNA anti-recombination protein RmuC